MSTEKVQSTQEKDTSLIPIGHYCYRRDIFYDGSKLKPGQIAIVTCPYSTYKNINGIDVPYCAYLERLGWDNKFTEMDMKKLVQHFGSEDAVFDKLNLDLLWDSCKECGENYDEDFGFTDEEFQTKEGKERYNKIVEDWLIKIKKLENGR